MKIKNMLMAPGLAAVLAVAACGGPEDFAAVLDDAVAKGLPGVALYVRADDGGVWTGHAGVSSIEDGTPLGADDKFLAFGVAQPFLAVTVMQMADEGLFSLDDTVPSLAGLDLVYEVPNVQKITLRHALRHTSGVFDYVETFGFQQAFLGENFDPDRVWTPLETLSFVSGRGYRPTFGPGESLEFSNSNTTLLGVAVEAVAGRSLGEELQDRIFDPLAMTSTRFGGADGLVPGYATLAANVVDYGIGAEIPEARAGLLNLSGVDPSWAWAAGGIVTTIADLGGFSEALFAGDLLSPDSQQALTDFQPPSWTRADDEVMEFSLGLMRRQTDGGPAIGHEGAGNGFESMMYRFPDLGITMVAVTNSSGQRATLEMVLQGVIDLVRKGDNAALFGG
ncbi:MAG: beta-lactamase family protein [Alphaproteobacteria bacterium]|mgnify:CR=1 FL=1|jgi:D-alanyl-D-alanine carboxypeptidase|nr:beta-lactamase family protein [Alphaproteobacteria bacterium]